jgi:hypothetical protein
MALKLFWISLHTLTVQTNRKVKTRRNIYLGIGSILILLNILMDMVELTKDSSSPAVSPYSVGYFLGAHILMIVGFLLLRMAYKVNQRIKSKGAIMLDRSIEAIGEK